MKKRELAIAVSLGTLLTSPVMANNLVTNGGFEDPSLADNSVKFFSSILGWTRSFGSMIEVQDNVAGAPYEGDNLVELDSTSSTGIYQDIPTVPNQTYTLQFALSPRPNTSATDNKLRVLWNNVELDTIAAGAGGSSTSWTVHSYSVVASSNPTRLEFQDQGTSNSLGTYIDGVSLVPTKECGYIYGVHDGGLNESQLIRYNSGGVEPLGPSLANYDIEALDISPVGELVGASGDDTDQPGFLYTFDMTSGTILSAQDIIGCNEIDGISFNPIDASLWGWDQEQGLVQITGNSCSSVISNQEGLEVEDLTWNNLGNVIYFAYNDHNGANPDQGNDANATYHIGRYSNNSVNWNVCEIGASEIEALEVLNDGNLLVGYHNKGHQFVKLVNLQTCEVTDSKVTDYTDIEGLATCLPESEPQVARSCQEIKTSDPYSEDGVYQIDPDGAGGTEPFDVYCDMTSNEGGWTLVLLKNSMHSGEYGDFASTYENLSVLSTNPEDASVSNDALAGWLNLNEFDYDAIRLASYNQGSQNFISNSIQQADLRINFGENGYFLYNDPNGYYWCGGERNFTDFGIGQVNPPVGAPSDCKGHSTLGDGWDFSHVMQVNEGLTITGTANTAKIMRGSYGSNWISYGNPGAAYAIWAK